MVKFKLIDLKQGTPEWHEFRKDKIGASDAAAIMGLSPFETPLQCWERITFDKKKPKTVAMERGSNLEAKARKWVNTKLKVNFQPAVIQSIEYPERIASLDGFEEVNGVIFLLEIKCPGQQDHQDAVNGRVPPHYVPQLQHIMDVAGVDEMLYCSFDGEEGRVVLCYKDEDFCRKLFCEEMAFIARLNDFKPPEPIDRDWVEINDLEAQGKAHRYQEISSLIEELEIERDGLRKGFIKSVQHPRSKVGSLKIQKVVRKGTVDYDKIEVLRDLDLEPYRKAPIETWRITF
jgi:putative phage-type endonuclease